MTKSKAKAIDRFLAEIERKYEFYIGLMPCGSMGYGWKRKKVKVKALKKMYPKRAAS